MPEDPFTAQLRAAQSMQAMKQVAGYPYMPYTSQATGYEQYGGSRAAADMIGGVFNAWIGKKAADYMNEQKEAESVFTLAKLGYDLGDLLADSKKRKAVEKYLGVTLPQTAEGDYGPQSIQRIQERMRKAILMDDRNQQTLATVLPAAQAEARQTTAVPPVAPPMTPWAPPEGPVTEDQYYRRALPSPVSADIYEQAPTPPVPSMAGAPGQALAPGQVPPIPGVGSTGPVTGVDPRMARILAADPEHQSKMEQLRQQGTTAIGAAMTRGQYDVAREQMRQTMAFTKLIGDNAQQLYRDYGGTLNPGATTDMAIAIATGRNPSQTTLQSFQNGMSPQQQELQKKYVDILKEAFPSLADAPGNLSVIAGMAAQGRSIPSEMLPGETMSFRDPTSGEQVTQHVPRNYAALMATWDLNFKKMQAEYGKLQVGQLNQLLSTPSEVAVRGADGKPVPLPMSLAKDFQTIRESMERIRASGMDIKNIDAVVTLLKSTSLRPEDKSIIQRTLAEQLGFKSADDIGFINWLRDYNQWRILPQVPPPVYTPGLTPGTSAGGPAPFGPAPAGPPRR